MGMKHNKVKAALAAAVALLVAGCGGGGDDAPPPPPTYTRMVSFGDSLSDVGTYRTRGVAALGGGQYTVNDFNPATRPKAGTNWTEQLAHELALPAPCAARTGLNSPAGGPLAALAEPVADHPTCFNYAQGGSRVTEPFGPGNAATLAVGDTRGYLGALTEPVAAQIAHHLAVAGGSFAAGDLVTVMAGGNDALVQLSRLTAAIKAGASADDLNVLGAQIRDALTLAGTQLVGLIQSQLLAKGAQRVVVVLLPDVGVTPAVAALSPTQRASVSQLALALNLPLLQAFANEPRVLVADAYTASELQALAPANYGLLNTTTPACDLTKASTALFCSAATTVAADVSKYWFSDDVHLTPYGYQLLARVVTDTMTRANWLAPSGSRPCNSQPDGCTLAPLPQ
ncbi:SGNH/GDSL hydrolase family protein [Azohydromonas australica]|uniref:SGNH/GDSL hydrolase family protein n=1 Tax=Azohydromonas australica TaxID=364039 RepID=UPI0004079CDA|nr:SGNH/GDSL hydrolase family protein [Azohydromonas australica]